MRSGKEFTAELTVPLRILEPNESTIKYRIGPNKFQEITELVAIKKELLQIAERIHDQAGQSSTEEGISMQPNVYLQRHE